MRSTLAPVLALELRRSEGTRKEIIAAYRRHKRELSGAKRPRCTAMTMKTIQPSTLVRLALLLPLNTSWQSPRKLYGVDDRGVRVRSILLGHCTAFPQTFTDWQARREDVGVVKRTQRQASSPRKCMRPTRCSPYTFSPHPPIISPLAPSSWSWPHRRRQSESARCCSLRSLSNS